MRTKLTITVDENIIPKLKIYARSQNTSLSQLIEDNLRHFVTPDKLSFTQKWRGRFKDVDTSTDDPRMQFLKDRYLK